MFIISLSQKKTNDTPITPQQQDQIHDLKQFLIKDGISHVPYDKLGELKHPDVSNIETKSLEELKLIIDEVGGNLNTNDIDLLQKMIEDNFIVAIDDFGNSIFIPKKEAEELMGKLHDEPIDNFEVNSDQEIKLNDEYYDVNQEFLGYHQLINIKLYNHLHMKLIV